MNRENESAQVPRTQAIAQRDKQAEETSWFCQGVEREVWTKPMLARLERGEEGTKWFSLIDKVRHPRTLELAWAKVHENAGASGVDGTTVGEFSKDSQHRLLAVNKHLTDNTYQPKPVKRVWIASLRSPLRARPWGPVFLPSVGCPNPAARKNDLSGSRRSQTAWCKQP